MRLRLRRLPQSIACASQLLPGWNCRQRKWVLASFSSPRVLGLHLIPFLLALTPFPLVIAIAHVVLGICFGFLVEVVFWC